MWFTGILPSLLYFFFESLLFQQTLHTSNRLTVSYTVQLSAAAGACCMIRVDTPINSDRTPSSFTSSFNVCQNPVYRRRTPSTPVVCVWIRVLITSKGHVTKPDSEPATSPLTKKALKFCVWESAERLPACRKGSKCSSSSRSSPPAPPRSERSLKSLWSRRRTEPGSLRSGWSSAEPSRDWSKDPAAGAAWSRPGESSLRRGPQKQELHRLQRRWHAVQSRNQCLQKKRKGYVCCHFHQAFAL